MLRSRLDKLLRARGLFQPPRARGGTAQIRLRQPLLAAAGGLLLVWYLARPGELSAAALTAVAGLLAAAYLWARALAQGLSASRVLSYAAVQVGDELEERVSLENRALLPALWIEFADHSDIPGHSLSSVRAADGQSRFEWRAHAMCTRRGNYRFGPWQLLSSDPFGIFSVTITYDQREELLVYPPLANLPAGLLPRGRARGDDRPLPLPLRAESQTAYSARPYQPGDPLRRVHWPTSARRDALYVRQFDPEAAATLWLMPDLDPAVQRGSGPDSTLETSVMLLASLAERLLDERLAVGLIAPGPRPQVVLPARGRPQLWPILRLLAGLEPSAPPLAAALAQSAALISPRSQLILVTPANTHPPALSLTPLRVAEAAGGGVNVGQFSSGSAAGKLPGMDSQFDWVGALTNLRRPAEVFLLDAASFSDADFPIAAQSENQRQQNSGETLASLGIASHILRRGDLTPRRASYGELSRWEFQVLGTGRALARRAPRRLAAVLGGSLPPAEGA